MVAREFARYGVYAAALDRRTPSPMIAANGESASETSGPSVIEGEGIAERVVRLNLPERRYTLLAAGAPGVIFLAGRDGDAPVIFKADVASGRAERFVEGSGNFTLSADGGRMLFLKSGNWFLVETGAPPKSDAGKLDLSKADIKVDPRAEWRQIFNESARLMRDYFYDAGLHGQDLAALKAHYAGYLPKVMTRAGLTQVMREMYAHIGVSHMQIGGGDQPGSPPANVGLLGADYEIKEGRYRITRIYRGTPQHPLLTGPLAQPGVGAQVGEYLLSIDGTEIEASRNLFAYFEGKAGGPVRLRIGPKADGTGARTVTVVPAPGESTLRTYTWMEENRRKVEEMSGGQLGYIYLPDTGGRGYELFNQYFHAQLDKQGLIIDERLNSGGAPADYFIDLLRRRSLSAYKFREGGDMPFPAGAIPGPRVMIINQLAGSGGDTLPWMFREAGLGVLVGKRTWGGGIGGYVAMPEFVDGGRMLAPNRGFYNPRTGEWDIENRGVAPDIEVEWLPADYRAGRDPQLERAVQTALEQLKKNPPPAPRQPRYRVVP